MDPNKVRGEPNFSSRFVEKFRQLFIFQFVITLFQNNESSSRVVIDTIERERDNLEVYLVIEMLSKRR